MLSCDTLVSSRACALFAIRWRRLYSCCTRSAFGSGAASLGTVFVGGFLPSRASGSTVDDHRISRTLA